MALTSIGLLATGPAGAIIALGHLGENPGTARKVALARDGKIVVAGQTSRLSQPRFRVIRLHGGTAPPGQIAIGPSAVVKSRTARLRLACSAVAGSSAEAWRRSPRRVSGASARVTYGRAAIALDSGRRAILRGPR